MAVKKKPAQHRARAAKPVLMDRNRIETSLESLNGLAIWRGLIQFTSVKFGGRMVITTTSENIEINFPIVEIFNFTKSQAIIASVTGIGIPKPQHGQMYEWEDAAIMLLKLAKETGGITPSPPPLKEEIRECLDFAWRAAGKPRAFDSGQFMQCMRQAKNGRRDSGLKTIPPTVFNAEGHCWVHAPSFRNWISTPSVADRRLSFADLREGLVLLGFEYQENITRGVDGDEETACLWRGPAMYD